ncbi:hypothetical protein [Halogranum rubrum]|uniref:Uncharacterized protein n=1 Tax=Halogranum salarium B-1 TaxID=1210908 RepID=J3A1B4_9EURY|nr:hypothetical protein [Halogranum salarium]EJN59108.1 hypothetical protein HSB1_25290 [Halogranum salarium B-1]
MSLLDSLRRPEHTGDNRCLPCTAVNSAFVLAVAGIVGRRWRPAGAAVLAVGAAAIAFRGYVVPYTPRFAPRLVERLPVEFKETEPSSDSFSTISLETDEVDKADEAVEEDASDDTESDRLPDSDSLTELDADGEQVMVALLDAGVIVDDGEAVRPSEDFAEAWESAMADLRELDDDALAAAVADAAPFEASGYVDDGDWVVVEGEGRAMHLTRVVAIAETAAVQVMADFDVPADRRVEAAEPLRMFVTTCPACGGAVEETNTDKCCGGSAGAYGGVRYEVLLCEECNALVYEFDETIEA